MRKELCIAGQRIRVDREATIALYRDTITGPGADACSCVSCKNFAAQRSSVYPPEFLSLLEELGADPRKEWEAFDNTFGLSRHEKHLYGGWFLFCGELVEEADDGPWPVPSDFSYSFTKFFPWGTLPKDANVCAVEFQTHLPWVIPEEPE